MGTAYWKHCLVCVLCAAKLPRQGSIQDNYNLEMIAVLCHQLLFPKVMGAFYIHLIEFWAHKSREKQTWDILLSVKLKLITFDQMNKYFNVNLKQGR